MRTSLGLRVVMLECCFAAVLLRTPPKLLILKVQFLL